LEENYIPLDLITMPMSIWVRNVVVVTLLLTKWWIKWMFRTNHVTRFCL